MGDDPSEFHPSVPAHSSGSKTEAEEVAFYEIRGATGQFHFGKLQAENRRTADRRSPSRGHKSVTVAARLLGRVPLSRNFSKGGPPYSAGINTRKEVPP